MMQGHCRVCGTVNTKLAGEISDPPRGSQLVEGVEDNETLARNGFRDCGDGGCFVAGGGIELATECFRSVLSRVLCSPAVGPLMEKVIGYTIQSASDQVLILSGSVSGVVEASIHSASEQFGSRYQSRVRGHART